MRIRKRYEVTVTEKICFCCKLSKLAKEFFKNAQLIGGLHTWCKQCCSEKHKKSEYAKKSGAIRKEKMKTDPFFAEQIKKAKNENRKKNITTSLLHSCKKRAEQKGLKFNLTKEDLVVPDLCPIFLVPLKCGTKDNYQFSPSVDRIDNEKGYVKGNIQIISKKANTIKNNATIPELLLFANWINKTFNYENNT